MSPEERLEWMESMDEEIRALSEHNAVELVPRQEPLSLKKQVVKSTWAFRKKRNPAGEVTKCKSRLCVCGDLMTEEFDRNDVFAPVVEWSTVRMLFTLGMLQNWKTASIDFKNAFTQGFLPEPIYLELPPGFANADP